MVKLLKKTNIIMRKILFTMAMAAIMQCVMSERCDAQVLEGLPYEKTHTQTRKPPVYQHERESDVVLSKIVWQRVELTERANQHLYFPTMPQDGRMSLIDVLLEGIHTQGLTAYDESEGNEFGSILTEKEVHQRMGACTKNVMVSGLDDRDSMVTINEPYNSSEIKAYLIKELWYYDKQRSAMDVRIAGICPLRTYFDDANDPEHEQPKVKQTFWVYYPEARGILANTECFNASNDAARLSYDDIFQKGIFSSYIYQESNIYNNRSISEYTRGEETLQNANRAKNAIFNQEQDMYEY